MSIKLNIDSLSEQTREKISVDLQLKLEASSFGKKRNKYLDIYSIEGDNVIVPFGYAITQLKIKKPSLVDYPKINIPFIFPLRDYQVPIKDQAIQFLNKTGCVLLSCYPGWGKTSGAIYLASKIKLKTIIILNRLILMSQWQESIAKFCPSAKIVCMKPAKTTDITDADFVIINAINVVKYGETFFKEFGTVIVDEAHVIMSEVLSKSLAHLFPKYLIGLSATPYRTDGLNALLTLYFSENKLVCKLFRKHTVYKVDTGFSPVMEFDQNGKVIWGKVLEDQCSNLERNMLIINIIKNHPERSFLVLSKRVEQVLFLYNILKDLGESVDTLVKSETTFDRTSRILIGTTGKVGIGFDHPKLDALVIASDIEEYFIQYLGRVFRRQDVEPIIFDLVDNNGILKKHYTTRKSIYFETGGEISKYKIKNN